MRDFLASFFIFLPPGTDVFSVTFAEMVFLYMLRGTRL